MRLKFLLYSAVVDALLLKERWWFCHMPRKCAFHEVTANMSEIFATCSDSVLLFAKERCYITNIFVLVL
jgi:hypothetical protein